NAAPGATSVSPSKNHRTSRLMSSSLVATRPSKDMDMSAMSLDTGGLLEEWLATAGHDRAPGPPEHRPGGHEVAGGWLIGRLGPCRRISLSRPSRSPRP